MRLPILLLLLGCGPTPPPEPTCVPLLDLHAAETAALCDQTPWQAPADCPMPEPAPCSAVVATLAACGLSSCEYEACAKALATSTCGDRPAACEPVLKCMSQPEPTTG